jgi:hypothetical protein
MEIINVTKVKIIMGWNVPNVIVFGESNKTFPSVVNNGDYVYVYEYEYEYDVTEYNSNVICIDIATGYKFLVGGSRLGDHLAGECTLIINDDGIVTSCIEENPSTVLNKKRNIRL